MEVMNPETPNPLPSTSVILYGEKDHSFKGNKRTIMYTGV